ncbi:MAG: hypothetical protein KatS3mg053_1029 [Candidatus Roseilinea sp.]|nr:MAG: hypothetical protein KatS3mg053_1029 [Candidatus Roseilinea sp.]
MSRATAFLVVLITAIATDLLGPFLLAARYPGYSHLRDTISALG